MNDKDVLFKFNFKQVSWLSYVCIIFGALISLFIPESYKAFSKLTNFILVPCALIFLYNLLQCLLSKGKIYYNHNMLKIVVCCTFVCILAALESFAQLILVMRTFIILLINFYYLQYRDVLPINLEMNIANIKIDLNDIFYCFFLLLVFINLLLYGSLSSDFYFPSVLDKNYTGILIYFLFKYR